MRAFFLLSWYFERSRLSYLSVKTVPRGPKFLRKHVICSCLVVWLCYSRNVYDGTGKVSPCPWPRVCEMGLIYRNRNLVDRNIIITISMIVTTKINDNNNDDGNKSVLCPFFTFCRGSQVQWRVHPKQLGIGQWPSRDYAPPVFRQWHHPQQHRACLG